MSPSDPLQLYKQGFAERTAGDLAAESEGRRMQQAQKRMADDRAAELIRVPSIDLAADLVQLDAEIDIARTNLEEMERRRAEIAQTMTRRGLRVSL